MDANIDELYENFLNPKVLRSRLLRASVYIAGFEALKDTIIRRLEDFYWIGFDESGDLMSPEYESRVLSRNSSRVYASLDWLKEAGAIDDSDIRSFDRIKGCRNTLAHGLLRAIASEGLPPNFSESFESMVSLTQKIEMWWVTNVTIPTDPQFDGVDVDYENIVTGGMALFRLLCDIALGDEVESTFYYDEFIKHTRQADSAQDNA